MTCLFLLIHLSTFGQDPIYSIEEEILSSYQATIKLDWQESQKRLENYSGQADLAKIYVQNFSEALKLYITEDPTLFEDFSSAQDERISAIKAGPESPYRNLFLADMKLYFAVIQLKFGNQWSAAWNFRQAYNYIDKNRLKYPNFSLDNKTEGLIQVAVAMTPRKYNWLLNFFGFEGSIEQGLSMLQSATLKEHLFHVESHFLLGIINGYLLEDPETGIDIIGKVGPNYWQLSNYILALLHMKASNGEEARQHLNEVKSVVIPTVDYQLGKIFFQKGDFGESLDRFTQFTALYTGSNYIKDSYFRMWLLSQLENSSTGTEALFDLATNEGATISEVDKNAERNLKNPPNLKITELRYATDGGYYKRAKALSDELATTGFSTTKDSVELNYRRARLYHKTNELEEAKKLYLETIRLSGKENWYFAPNSALQLGYLFEQEGRMSLAKQYFEQAIEYKNHDYESSIENKAKIALEKLD